MVGNMSGHIVYYNVVHLTQTLCYHIVSRKNKKVKLFISDCLSNIIEPPNLDKKKTNIFSRLFRL